MMDMRDIDLYNTMLNERQNEILSEIRRHTLLKGAQMGGTRRGTLVALIGAAVLLAAALIASGVQLFV